MERNYDKIEENMLLYKPKNEIIKDYIKLLKKVDQAIKYIDLDVRFVNMTEYDTLRAILDDDEEKHIIKIYTKYGEAYNDFKALFSGEKEVYFDNGVIEEGKLLLEYIDNLEEQIEYLERNQKGEGDE